jgi:hypothetical protein
MWVRHQAHQYDMPVHQGYRKSSKGGNSNQHHEWINSELTPQSMKRLEA